MYYYTGKTDNKIILDKHIRVAGDFLYFINNGAVYDGSHGFVFKESQDCFYLPSGQTTLVDEVEVINPNISGFFTKAEIVDFTINTTVCLGKLVFTEDILDITAYFTQDLDDRSNQPEDPTLPLNQVAFVLKSLQSFQSLKIDELNAIQYILTTPIRTIQYQDQVFSDHVFIFSHFYDLNKQSSLKLYIVPN